VGLFEPLEHLQPGRQHPPQLLAEVAFDGFPVPAANLIGEEGRGFYYQMSASANGRLQTAARAVGLLQAAYEAALRYARERVVFGKPLIDYGLTRAKLTRMAVLIQGCRQFSYEVARLLAKGGDDGQLEASMVKMYACRAAEWVTRSAADPRRHGLRRGVRRLALLRRRPRALDLRRG
jgi:(2S)-methylsuccinyl-CoA dehydrogenase